MRQKISSLLISTSLLAVLNLGVNLSSADAAMIFCGNITAERDACLQDLSEAQSEIDALNETLSAMTNTVAQITNSYNTCNASLSLCHAQADVAGVTYFDPAQALRKARRATRNNSKKARGLISKALKALGDNSALIQTLLNEDIAVTTVNVTK